MRGRLSGLSGKWKVAAAVAAVLLAGVGAGAMAQVTAPVSGVMKVRLGGDATETRLVIDVDRAVTAKPGTSGGAGQIVLDFPKVALPAEMRGGGQGVIRRWVFASKGGSSKLTIDLARDAEISRRFLLPPGDGVPHYRYVVDVKARGTGKPFQVAAAPPPAPSAEPVSIRARQTDGRKIIVIDAGHGGYDPGALGAAAQEKAVTLAAAKALKARLERSGRYTVILTRDRDVYVPLEGRVQIARRADADLFISLHADAGPADVSGASVYTLSEKGEGRAAKVLNKDDWLMNASLVGGDKSVSQILLDLTQRSTKNRSAAFAELLVSEIGDETALLRRSHRSGNLVVLLAPDVPAVLLEMGFITSPRDERLLTTAADRSRLMNAVGDAIDLWFAKQTRVASR